MATEVATHQYKGLEWHIMPELSFSEDYVPTITQAIAYYLDENGRENIFIHAVASPHTDAGPRHSGFLTIDQLNMFNALVDRFKDLHPVVIWI